LKKRGKYFNPLANSKKDSKGGVFVPEKLSNVDNPLLIAQAKKTFAAVDDSRYYKEALKRVPMGKPVWTYWLTSPFGTRSDPFNSKRAAHKGVDLASNRGNKVKTMAAGKVVKAGTATGYGKMVEIDHGNGFRTRYAHLNAVYVKAGQWVNAEHAVGEVGSTGRSTGPHLHYEVLYAGVNMDPMVFIKAK
jgi:murein DD-endopeptidase MepM/ murein hydrolase activator NlpD